MKYFLTMYAIIAYSTNVKTSSALLASCLVNTVCACMNISTPQSALAWTNELFGVRQQGRDATLCE